MNEQREGLRADPRTRDVPAIMLTASVQERQRARGIELGACAFMSKPFSSAELEERVTSLLRSR